LGIVNPPNIFIRKLAPLGAWLFPTVPVEGNIPVENISRLPKVIELIKSDPMIHRQISFGTGNVVLQLTNRLQLSRAPSIPLPVLCVHGTADRITEYGKESCSYSF
jgi:alpha-beta hydrolase superfamily lysophospholipase